MRGHTNRLLILLDSGAGANFSYTDLWKTTTTIAFNNITITKLQTKHCKPIITSAAFGKDKIIDTKIQLQVNFSNHSLTAWFN